MRSIQTELIQAVASGDGERVRALLDQGVSPDARDAETTWPALCVALSLGRGDIATLLIERGANPNAEGPYEMLIDRSRVQGARSALRLAVRAGLPDVVRALLAGGARPDDADRLDGATALYEAATRGDEPSAAALTGAGADVDRKNTYYDLTPLVAAIQSGHERVALHLLAAGARADPAALQAACARGSVSVADRLVALGAPVLQEGSGRSLLESAVSGGLAAVEWVLARPEGAALVARHGVAALRAAAHFGVPDVLQRLIKEGVPVDGQNAVGWTALISAAWNGRGDIVRALLAAGADPRRPDATGKTAAQWAAQANHAEIAQLLETAVAR
jgi:ankyrin repeat protein